MSEDYPRVVFTRRADRKKGDLFFGPFFAGTARRILKLIADQFKLRSCDLEITEGKNALTRPCLYYDMHQCLGPCVVGLTTTDAYREMVDDVVLFLSGKSKELQDRLTQRMYRSAENRPCSHLLITGLGNVSSLSPSRRSRILASLTAAMAGKRTLLKCVNLRTFRPASSNNAR